MPKEEILETGFVRDSDGCVYKIENSDKEGVYLSAPDTETFRVSMDKLLDEFVKAEKN